VTGLVVKRNSKSKAQCSAISAHQEFEKVVLRVIDDKVVRVGPAAKMDGWEILCR